MDIERMKRKIVSGFAEDVAARGFEKEWKSVPKAARDGILELRGLYELLKIVFEGFEYI